MAGPFSSVTAPRDGAHRKNRKKKINIKAKRGSERWCEDLRSERGNGGRKREVKVPGKWVTSGLAGSPPRGTEETERRHHRQTDGRGSRRTDGTVWPQASGPGLCLMRCLQHWLWLTLKAEGRGGSLEGWPSAGSVPTLSWGPAAKSWGAQAGRMGLGSHMQAGCFLPEVPAARGQAPG